MFSRPLRARLYLSTLLIAAGCGGKLDEEGDDSRSGDRGAMEPSQRPSRSAPPDPVDEPPGTTPLGECKLGFDPREEPDRRCDWLADELCYSDKLAACACACPANTKNTYCASDFPEPNGRVR